LFTPEFIKTEANFIAICGVLLWDSERSTAGPP